MYISKAWKQKKYKFCDNLENWVKDKKIERITIIKITSLMFV
jgi:hypothetical protein